MALRFETYYMLAVDKVTLLGLLGANITCLHITPQDQAQFKMLKR
jgi:hypothetical protein